MRRLPIALSFIFFHGSTIFAQELPQTHSVFLSGTLISTERLCPAPENCIADGLKIKIAFTLECQDEFGSYDYRILPGGQLIFAMTALRQPRLPHLRCIQDKTRVVEVLLPQVFPPLEIQFLGRGESVLIP